MANGNFDAAKTHHARHAAGFGRFDQTSGYSNKSAAQISDV
jgi:hypothetical protein